MIWKKTFKLVANYFPLNQIRVWALRQAGYSVGRQVYIGEKLYVTENFEHGQHKLYVGDRIAIAQHVLIILDSDPNWSYLRDKV